LKIPNKSPFAKCGILAPTRLKQSGFSGVGGGPFYGTGYYSGGLGLVIIIRIVLPLMGRI
jgi:hypothetical protein